MRGRVKQRDKSETVGDLIMCVHHYIIINIIYLLYVYIVAHMWRYHNGRSCQKIVDCGHEVRAGIPKHKKYAQS